MTTHVYIVIAQGIYRHDILGVYRSQREAEDRARLIAGHADGWHEYVVFEAEIGADIEDAKRICAYQYDEKHGNRWHWEADAGERKQTHFLFNEWREPKRLAGSE
jgi:hypothetical protein